MSFVFAMLLVSAELAGAQQPVAPARPTADAPKLKAKKICKADPETSGTRMTKRLCLTEEEWAQRSESMYDSSRAGFSGKAQNH